LGVARKRQKRQEKARKARKATVSESKKE